MNKVEIKEKVGTILEELMDTKFETGDERFIEDLHLDSLDTVELVMEFEDEFDLVIKDEVAEKWTTVNKAIDGLHTLLSVA